MDERQIDMAIEAQDRQTELSIAQARKKAAMPAGMPGECDWCGMASMRLINSACAPCRDKYRLG